MAASWRNLTVLAESVRVFTATSTTRPSVVHWPLLTIPNSPVPKWETILCVGGNVDTSNHSNMKTESIVLLGTVC